MDDPTKDSGAPHSGPPIDDASEALTMAPDAGGTLPAPSGERDGLLAPGQRFGPYAVHRLLGRGGMGEVYEAEENDSGRRIALKLFNRPIGNPVERDRFLREGQLAASISHPNSVYIFGTDEIQGIPVIAMELASAGTLKDAVNRGGPLPPAKAADAILQVIDGLEAAAAVGVLHRDIKPANCFVDRDGTVKVGDFGLSISTLARDETHLTMAGTILGTPAFASPEQMRGDALDVRADIYSVGATLYYLLTGRAPFEEANVVKLVGQVLTDLPPSPRSVKPAVPRGLATVVLKCLGKSPADRPQTYAALRQTLLPFASLAPTPATLRLRFLAHVVDNGITGLLSLNTLISALRALGGSRVPDVGLWTMVADLAIWVAYFAVLEGLWGQSVGKALFRLRVTDADRQVPGLRRGSVRACVFGALQTGPALAAILAFGGPDAYGASSSKALAAGWWLGAVVIALLSTATGVLFSTARRSNGFAGLHDLASGTRVVSKAAVAAGLAAREHTRVVAAPDGARVIGPYQALEDAAAPAQGVLVAYDPRLRRNVWVRPQPNGSDALPAARRDLSRKGRLRWLTGLRTPADSWDAFEAVDGRPFATAIEHPQPWRVVRIWLKDLADEVEAASKDGTLPGLGTDAVWVGSDGHVRLLDGSGAFGDVDSGEIQDFLLRVARSALAGRLAASPEEARALPTGPVPLSARRLLEDLSKRRFESIREVVETVGGLMTQHADTYRRLRVGHLALTVLVPALLLPGMIFAISTDWQRAEANAWLNVLARGDRAGGDGLSPEAREAVTVYAASLLPPDTSQFPSRVQPMIERLRRAHPRVTTEERQRAEAKLSRLGIDRGAIASRERRTIAIAAFFGWAALWSFLAVVSLLSATLAGGGLLLSLFGIAVVRKDGTPASRWRCFLRALMAWLPVVVGSLSAYGLAASGTIRRAFETTRAGDRALMVAGVLAGIVVVAVFVGGAIRAVVRPERGWQDQIAGTWLVPK